MIKEPHLDHTQALSSYVSGSFGTLKVFLYELEIFPNPFIDFTTKRFNKSRSKKMQLFGKWQSVTDAYKSFYEKVLSILSLGFFRERKKLIERILK